MEEASNTPPPTEAPAGEVTTTDRAPFRKVAILGFSDTVKDAPFHDPTWELWAMNGFQRHLPGLGLAQPVAPERFGVWFDMHTLDYIRSYGNASNTGDQQLEWLRLPHPFPVFMLEAFPEFPAARAYPIDLVKLATGRDYFTSTVAYALALALMAPEVAEVGVWGVDLVHGTEWGDQRPCAEYWIGRLEAAGKRVTIHEKSALLRHRARYGYDDVPQVVRDIRGALELQAEQLTKAVNATNAEIEAKRGQAYTDHGALQVVQGLLERLDIWGRGGRI